MHVSYMCFTSAPQAIQGSYTEAGVYSPLAPDDDVDHDELARDSSVCDAVAARLDNVGALFKGPTLRLFGVPRHAEAAKAVRMEASLLSLRRVGKVLEFPDVKCFTRTFEADKVQTQSLVQDVCDELPELENDPLPAEDAGGIEEDVGDFST